MRRGPRVAATLAALAAVAISAALLASGTAHGERAEREGVIVSIAGGIAPRKLPRHRPVPVAVRLQGSVETGAGVPLPRVTKLELAIAGPGLLSTRGLPACPRERLRSADGRLALQRCGAALVGRGRLQAVAFVPHQAPIGLRGSLLAFNGRTRSGRPAVWVHTFVASPPVSIVLPFYVRRRRGRTLLVARIPRSLGPWPHLTRFALTLSRRYRYRGRPRSYLSASCPLPPSFTAGFVTFARAVYGFADGRGISVESVRGCRARR